MTVREAAALIRAGGLVAFATETVYGLGANALDAAAVRRIYEIKGRPATSPLIVHVSSVGMARDLAAGWSELAGRLAALYWPGPLTLVLPKRPHVPGVVTAGLDTVALRMPAHPQALELIATAGVPVAAPSANRFTQLSPTTARHVQDAFEGRVPVLDGGPCAVGIESTVLSLAGPAPVLLRPGMIPRDELVAIAGPLAEPAAGPEAAGGAHASPGQHERHYQPRTPLYLDHGEGRPGRGLLLRHGRELPATASEYAARLYGILHEADAAGYDWIAIEPPPGGAVWEGIRDRLQRAAARRTEGT
ncbi:MAG: threonylcarbamoyl-AMP synthase [Bryobacterales bacterium]|nr:threonylcarbamoyl-AMP synthase [Bryobacterales bacterium]